jgi:hypothetical protein
MVDLDVVGNLAISLLQRHLYVEKDKPQFFFSKAAETGLMGLQRASYLQLKNKLSVVKP